MIIIIAHGEFACPRPLRSHRGVAPLLGAFIIYLPWRFCYYTVPRKRAVIMNQAIKTLSSLLVIIDLVGCSKVHPIAPTIPITPTEFTDTIGKIESSILPIVCYRFTSGHNEIVSVEGTGFFVAVDGTFVTAAHVVDGITDPNRNGPCPFSGFYLPSVGIWTIEEITAVPISIFPFRVVNCRRDATVDIAACRSTRSVTGSIYRVVPVTFEPNLRVPGTPIAFAGFPLQNQVPLSALGNVAGYANVVDSQGPHDLLIDRTAWHGASGSPIYTIDGKVIGMVRATGIGDAIGLAVGTPSRLIQIFLSQANSRDCNFRFHGSSLFRSKALIPHDPTSQSHSAIYCELVLAQSGGRNTPLRAISEAGTDHRRGYPI